ncbi:MAG: Gfo/Idh/MocA family oxidoreductase [Candidatus Poribacteria bacterium]|nr:Gfo/Idh/MocA family oxidoreductase [Candidatus Poribacteria bacterium]
MVEKVRVGFIGTGGIAGNHIGNLKGFDDVEFAAMCDVSKDRAEARAKEFGGAPYTSFEEMYEKEDLDAVYVCVPPFAHGEPELAGIEKGIPLFIEKPIDADIDIALKVRDAVVKADALTSVGYNWRYSDAVQAAREKLLDYKVLGACGYWMGGMPGTPWWRVRKQSGGQHVEQTTHVFDVSRFLLRGNAVSVHAAAAKGCMTDIDNYDIEDLSFVNVTYDNGTIANIQSGCCFAGWGRVKIEIFGRNLAADITQGKAVFVTGRDEKVEIESTVNPYQLEDRIFIDAVKSGDRSKILAPYTDALETQKMMVAATRSMDTGKTVFIQNDQFVIA